MSTGVFILVFQSPSTLSSSSTIRATLSAWRRPSDTSMSPRLKASANYLTCRIMITDARSKGFDYPILLSADGHVAEGPLQSIFLVRNGVLITPGITDGILEGVTPDTVLRLAKDIGVGAEERGVDPTELFIAEEIFLVGTMSELLPVREVDHLQVGDGGIGPVTLRIREQLLDVVRGRSIKHADWALKVAGLQSGHATWT